MFKPSNSMDTHESHSCKSLDLIAYNSENFLKILVPNKKSDLFFVLNDNYTCFKFNEPDDPCYYFEKRLVSNSDCKNYTSAVQALAQKNSGEITKFFSDVRPTVKDLRWAQVESHTGTPDRVYSSALFSDNEQERLEAIKIMGCKFKIHLQVKPEYIISFINDFSKLLYKDPRLHSITSFKVVKPDCFDEMTSQNFPIIVVYLPIFYESDPIKRSEILDSFIDAINDYYADFVYKIAWTRTEPRFNYKINDLVHIAGSEGCLKDLLTEYLKKQKNQELLAAHTARIFYVFTPDFKFVKGFEYTPKGHRR